MEKLTNQDRFDILRGYYQDGKFHPKGRPGVSMSDLLHQMDFEKFDDFLVWYKSLTQSERKNGEKNWCSGKCCHSNLSMLLKPKREQKRIVDIISKRLKSQRKMIYDGYKPKTIKKAIESCFIRDKTVELDLLYEQPRRPFDWLYKNLNKSVIEVCELNDNPALLRACNAKTADEAARVIIEALWRDSNLQG